MKTNLSMVQRLSKHEFNVLARVSIWCHMFAYLEQVIKKVGQVFNLVEITQHTVSLMQRSWGNCVSATFN